MTSVGDLGHLQVGAGEAPDPKTAAEQLAALLDLPAVGVGIRGARIVGRGGRASADLYLSDGTEICFESLREMGNASRLTLEVAACTGATPRLKAPQAIRAVALVRALAEHHEAFTADEITLDWAVDYLQAVEVLDVNMTDQHERWAAFSHLLRIDPVAHSREHGGRIAAANVVLRDLDGTRFVRCGWFREAIRSQDSSVSPQELAQRMERVGWLRRGSAGRIKASQPRGSGRLGWSFYVVPKDWEASE